MTAPTPLTDAAKYLATDEDWDETHWVVKADFARRLEQMCAELAKALEVTERWHRLKGDAPRKLDAALSWKENDLIMEDKANEALAAYAKMKEEMGK